MKHTSIFHKSIFVIDNQLSSQFCTHIINKFEDDVSGHVIGKTAAGTTPGIKQSTDLEISYGPKREDWVAEDRALSEALTNGIVKYDHHLAKKMPGMAIAGEMFDTGHQIQRTSPGGFYDWHHDGCDTRQLTFIFYLNDVKGGGGCTEFCDGTKVYPRAGRLLIFPATGQYLHRGVAPKKDLKYIITGWCHTPVTSNPRVLKMSGLELANQPLQTEEHGHLEN